MGDERQTDHKTFTNYALMKHFVDRSPFRNVTWYHYWDNIDRKSRIPRSSKKCRFLPKGARVNSEAKPLNFVRNDIDYSLGWIMRTPDNDPRAHQASPSKDLGVTSLVFDLVKEKPQN